MASVSNSTGKRTSDINADDAGVPAPKRTCNNNVEDVNRDIVINSMKENPASAALALSKLLSCEACKSFARAPIQYCD